MTELTSTITQVDSESFDSQAVSHQVRHRLTTTNKSSKFWWKSDKTTNNSRKIKTDLTRTTVVSPPDGSFLRSKQGAEKFPPQN